MPLTPQQVMERYGYLICWTTIGMPSVGEVRVMNEYDAFVVSRKMVAIGPATKQEWCTQNNLMGDCNCRAPKRSKFYRAICE